MVTIGELKLGKVDGKDEFLLQGDGVDDFYDAFLVPDNIELASFEEREIYYITGFRGTGKTSLLRYILWRCQKDEKYRVIILFKSEIEEEKRMQISNQVGAVFSEANSNKMGISQDYKSAWTWFIMHQIGSIMITQPDCYTANDSSETFLRLMGLAKETPFKKVLGFLPKLEGAKVKISADIPIFQANIDLDFEKENSTSATALFSEVVSAALFSMTNVKFQKKLVIGIDELEVFFFHREQYDRDLSMVRDLIFAVDRVNQKLRAKNAPILLMAAIRREIVDAIGVLGQEVNRVVHDRGVGLSWHHAQRSLRHPLIEMVRRKIRHSLGKGYDGDPIQDFFDATVDGEPLDAYLLDRSFYRPRDIMWRLTFAQKIFPREERFGNKSLRETESEYSKQLWAEICYELGATFSSDEVKAIESIFSGIKRTFYIKDIEEIAKKKSRYSNSILAFTKNNSLIELCEKLYSNGALGNEFRTGSTGNIFKNRWIFRGDQNLIVDQRMTLNPAVRKALSAIDLRKRGVSGGRKSTFDPQ